METRTGEEVVQEFHALIQEQRREPDPDLTERSIAEEFVGELSENEMRDVLITLLTKEV